MEIENKRSRITELVDNIKKHSDYLNELESIPVLEIGVIVSKINKLHEEASILKYLCEKQQGKRVQLQSDDLIVTNLPENEATTTPEHMVDSDPIGEAEEGALLQAKEENEPTDALDHMLEASAEASERVLDDAVENEAASNFFAQKNSVEDSNKAKVEPEEATTDNQAIESKKAENDDTANDRFNQIKAEAETKNTLDKIEKEQEIPSKPDLNEAFAKEDSSLSDHLQKQPIADLMSAIGLNERYLYSNDLFDGDMQEFKNAIKMLNEFENVEEAKAFFDSGLRSTYNWEDDDPLAQALLSLVVRRYL